MSDVSALHVFDLDGTLLRGSTVSLELARVRGELAELEELEAAFAAGTLDTVGFALRLRALWHDLTADVVAVALETAPWITGIAEVCADIAERGERSMLVTMSPDLFTAGLRDLGLHTVHASRFPPLPFAAPLDPAGILVPEDKVRLVEEELDATGVAAHACVAYGDSLSDAPLFRRLRRTVAVNASADLRALATASYDGDDLREAYALGRSLLDGTPA
jgi:phosphoserine phosphatase